MRRGPRAYMGQARELQADSPADAAAAPMRRYRGAARARAAVGGLFTRETNRDSSDVD
jgi:hypothetical protein